MRRFLLGLMLLVIWLSDQFSSAAQGPITPIYDIQYTTDPAGVSPYNGQIVTTTGIAVAVYPYGYVLEEADGGPWSGIYVYDADHVPREGDEIFLTGTVAEYYGLTEIQEGGWYTVTQSARPLPPVAVVTTAQIANHSFAEAYEGVLVATEAVTVTNPDVGYGEW